jgi:hypothetical protein
VLNFPEKTEAIDPETDFTNMKVWGWEIGDAALQRATQPYVVGGCYPAAWPGMIQRLNTLTLFLSPAES